MARLLKIETVLKHHRQFVPIEEVPKLSDDTAPIMGCLVIKYGDRILLGRQHIEAVDVIWEGVVRAVADAVEKRFGEFPFPGDNHDFVLQVEKTFTGIRIEGDPRQQIEVPEEVFFTLFLHAATSTFQSFIRLNPKGFLRYQKVLATLEKMRDRFAAETAGGDAT
ncbi:MAG: hypothetical protein RLY93_05775 [Sumerlaeia bacterium]